MAPSAARRRVRVVVSLLALLALTGCRIEGRSRRVQELLAELSPLTLGETLGQARSAVPGLRVQHPGDRWMIELEPDSARPLLAGVIVAPNPAEGDSASPDAVVESVEFLLTSAQALRLRARTLALLGEPTSVACAGRSISETDSVIEWARNPRGGVLFTSPYRRLNGEPSVARLFVYSSRWDPRRALSGYGIRTCDD
jgi:hypothetical protein